MARQSVQVCLHGVCCSHTYLLHVPNESVYVVTDLANLSETNKQQDQSAHTCKTHTHNMQHTHTTHQFEATVTLSIQGKKRGEKPSAEYHIICTEGTPNTIQHSTRTHTHMHARTHARMHACMHARTHACTHTHTHTHTHLCSVPYKSYAPSATHPLAAHKEHSTIQSAHVPTRPSMVASSTLQSDCAHNHKHCKHLEGRRRNACLLLLQQSCQLGEGRQ